MTKQHKKNQPRKNTLVFENLEPRLLLSADVAALSELARESLQQEVEQTVYVNNEVNAGSSQEVFSLIDDEPSQALSQNLVFVIDSAVENAGLIEAEITNKYGGLTKVTPENDLNVLRDNKQDQPVLIYLDNNLGGFAQLNTFLENQQNIDAIQIFSHGANGQIFLGSDAINAANIDQFENELSQLGSYLSEQADILFYACDVTASENGTVLIEKIAQYSNADIAASEDKTGTNTNANWKLETTTGVIEAQKLTINSYQSTLSDTGIDFNGEDLIDTNGWFEIEKTISVDTNVADKQSISLGSFSSVDPNWSYSIASYGDDYAYYLDTNSDELFVDSTQIISGSLVKISMDNASTFEHFDLVLTVNLTDSGSSNSSSSGDYFSTEQQTSILNLFDQTFGYEAITDSYSSLDNSFPFFNAKNLDSAFDTLTGHDAGRVKLTLDAIRSFYADTDLTSKDWITVQNGIISAVETAWGNQSQNLYTPDYDDTDEILDYARSLTSYEWEAAGFTLSGEPNYIEMSIPVVSKFSNIALPDAYLQPLIDDINASVPDFLKNGEVSHNVTLDGYAIVDVTFSIVKNDDGSIGIRNQTSSLNPASLDEFAGLTSAVFIKDINGAVNIPTQLSDIVLDISASKLYQPSSQLDAYGQWPVNYPTKDGNPIDSTEREFIDPIMGPSTETVLAFGADEYLFKQLGQHQDNGTINTEVGLFSFNLKSADGKIDLTYAGSVTDIASGSQTGTISEQTWIEMLGLEGADAETIKTNLSSGLSVLDYSIGQLNDRVVFQDKSINELGSNALQTIKNDIETVLAGITLSGSGIFDQITNLVDQVNSALKTQWSLSSDVFSLNLDSATNKLRFDFDFELSQNVNSSLQLAFADLGISFIKDGTLAESSSVVASTLFSQVQLGLLLSGSNVSVANNSTTNSRVATQNAGLKASTVVKENAAGDSLSRLILDNIALDTDWTVNSNLQTQTTTKSLQSSTLNGDWKYQLGSDAELNLKDDTNIDATHSVTASYDALSSQYQYSFAMPAEDAFKEQMGLNIDLAVLAQQMTSALDSFTGGQTDGYPKLDYTLPIISGNSYDSLYKTAQASVFDDIYLAISSYAAGADDQPGDMITALNSNLNTKYAASGQNIDFWTLSEDGLDLSLDFNLATNMDSGVNPIEIGLETILADFTLDSEFGIGLGDALSSFKFDVDSAFEVNLSFNSDFTTDVPNTFLHKESQISVEHSLTVNSAASAQLQTSKILIGDTASALGYSIAADASDIVLTTVLSTGLDANLNINNTASLANLTPAHSVTGQLDVYIGDWDTTNSKVTETSKKSLAITPQIKDNVLSWSFDDSAGKSAFYGAFYDSILDGMRSLFDGATSAIGTVMDGANALPVVGDQISDNAESAFKNIQETLLGQYSETYNSYTGGLGEFLRTQAENAVGPLEALQQGIFAAVGGDYLYKVVEDGDGNAVIADENTGFVKLEAVDQQDLSSLVKYVKNDDEIITGVEMDLVFAKDVDLGTLEFDLHSLLGPVMDGFGVTAEAGIQGSMTAATRFNIAYDFENGLYLKTDGIVQTTDYNDEFALQLKLNLTDNTEFGVDMGVLAGHIKGETSDSITGIIGIDLAGADDNDEDDPEAWNITGERKEDVDVTARADIILNTDFETEVSALDSLAVKAQLAVTAEWENSLTAEGVDVSDFGIPDVMMNDVTLNLGTFGSDVLKPMADAMDPILEPMAPIMEALGTSLDFLPDDANTVAKFLDKLAAMKGYPAHFAEMVEIYETLVEFKSTVSELDDSGDMHIGSFALADFLSDGESPLNISTYSDVVDAFESFAELEKGFGETLSVRNINDLTDFFADEWDEDLFATFTEKMSEDLEDKLGSKDITDKTHADAIVKTLRDAGFASMANVGAEITELSGILKTYVDLINLNSGLNGLDDATSTSGKEVIAKAKSLLETTDWNAVLKWSDITKEGKEDENYLAYYFKDQEDNHSAKFDSDLTKVGALDSAKTALDSTITALELALTDDNQNLTAQQSADFNSKKAAFTAAMSDVFVTQELTAYMVTIADKMQLAIDAMTKVDVTPEEDDSTLTDEERAAKDKKKQQAESFKDKLKKYSQTEASAEGGSLKVDLPILTGGFTPIYNLLTNQTTDLVTIHMQDKDGNPNPLSVAAGAEIKIPIIAPFLNATIGGEFNAELMLGFGLDTKGFLEWKKTDYDPNQVASVLLDGFYVSDSVYHLDESGSYDGVVQNGETYTNIDENNGLVEDFDELTLDMVIEAGVSLGITGLVEAGVKGGIETEAAFNLNDVPVSGEETGDPTKTYDGKLYLSEIAKIIDTKGPECLFDIDAEANAFLEAFIWVGIDLGFYTATLFEESEEFARIELFSIQHHCDLDDKPYRLAQFDNGELELGWYQDKAAFDSHAFKQDRQLYKVSYVNGEDHYDATDFNENKAKIENANWIKIESGGYTEYYLADTVTKVTTVQSKFDDRYKFDASLNNALRVDANGNDLGKLLLDVKAGGGNDYVVMDADGENITRTIDGGAGDDRIYGSFAEDTIYGGAGNDNIFAYYGQDERAAQITEFGGDKIYAGDGADVVVGGQGNDHIEGNAGADRLVSGGGSDTVYGGNGPNTSATSHLDARDHIYLTSSENDTADTRSQVYGQTGDDLIYLTPGQGSSAKFAVDGGHGDDHLLVQTLRDDTSENQIDIKTGTRDGEEAISISFDGTELLLTQDDSIEQLAIHAGQGADTVTVHDLKGHTDILKNLDIDVGNTLNLADGYANIDPDKEQDQIIIVGTEQADDFALRTSMPLLFSQEEGEVDDGNNENANDAVGGVAQSGGNDAEQIQFHRSTLEMAYDLEFSDYTDSFHTAEMDIQMLANTNHLEVGSVIDHRFDDAASVNYNASFKLLDGEDAAKFSIDEKTGALTLKSYDADDKDSLLTVKVEATRLNIQNTDSGIISTKLEDKATYHIAFWVGDYKIAPGSLTSEYNQLIKDNGKDFKPDGQAYIVSKDIVEGSSIKVENLDYSVIKYDNQVAQTPLSESKIIHFTDYKLVTKDNFADYQTRIVQAITDNDGNPNNAMYNRLYDGGDAAEFTLDSKTGELTFNEGENTLANNADDNYHYLTVVMSGEQLVQNAQGDWQTQKYEEIRTVVVHLVQNTQISFGYLNQDKLLVKTLGGNDTVDLSQIDDKDFLAEIKVETGSGDDKVKGSEFADIFDTGTGNDTVEGRAGSDSYIDESGNDTLIVDVAKYFGNVAYKNVDVSVGDYQFHTDIKLDVTDPDTQQVSELHFTETEDLGGLFEQLELSGTISKDTLSVIDWTNNAKLDGRSAGDTYEVQLKANQNYNSEITIDDTGTDPGTDTLVVRGSDGDDAFASKVENGIGYIAAYSDNSLALTPPTLSNDHDNSSKTHQGELSGFYQKVVYGKVLGEDEDGNLLNSTVTEKIEVHMGKGNDTFVSYDNAASVDVYGDEGRDSFLIGVITDVVEIDHPQRQDEKLAVIKANYESGKLVSSGITDGVTFNSKFHGGSGDDYFEINHNKGEVDLLGESGNDLFYIQAHILQSENGGAYTDGKALYINQDALLSVGLSEKHADGKFADASHTEESYSDTVVNHLSTVKNNKVVVNGGSGLDALAIGTTPLDDKVYIYVEKDINGVKKLRIYAEGLQLDEIAGVERVVIITGAGNDTVYVNGLRNNDWVELYTGAGDDTVYVGGEARNFTTVVPENKKSYQVQIPQEKFKGQKTIHEGQFAIGESELNLRDVIDSNAFYKYLKDHLPEYFIEDIYWDRHQKIVKEPGQDNYWFVSEDKKGENYYVYQLNKVYDNWLDVKVSQIAIKDFVLDDTNSSVHDITLTVSNGQPKVVEKTMPFATLEDIRGNLVLNDQTGNDTVEVYGDESYVSFVSQDVYKTDYQLKDINWNNLNNFNAPEAVELLYQDSWIGGNLFNYLMQSAYDDANQTHFENFVKEIQTQVEVENLISNGSLVNKIKHEPRGYYVSNVSYDPATQTKSTTQTFRDHKVRLNSDEHIVWQGGLPSDFFDNLDKSIEQLKSESFFDNYYADEHKILLAILKSFEVDNSVKEQQAALSAQDVSVFLPDYENWIKNIAINYEQAKLYETKKLEITQNVKVADVTFNSDGTPRSIKSIAGENPTGFHPEEDSAAKKVDWYGDVYEYDLDRHLETVIYAFKDIFGNKTAKDSKQDSFIDLASEVNKQLLSYGLQFDNDTIQTLVPSELFFLEKTFETNSFGQVELAEATLYKYDNGKSEKLKTWQDTPLTTIINEIENNPNYQVSLGDNDSVNFNLKHVDTQTKKPVTVGEQHYYKQIDLFSGSPSERDQFIKDALGETVGEHRTNELVVATYTMPQTLKLVQVSNGFGGLAWQLVATSSIPVSVDEGLFSSISDDRSIAYSVDVITAEDVSKLEDSSNITTGIKLSGYDQIQYSSDYKGGYFSTRGDGSSYWHMHSPVFSKEDGRQHMVDGHLHIYGEGKLQADKILIKVNKQTPVVDFKTSADRAFEFNHITMHNNASGVYGPSGFDPYDKQAKFNNVIDLSKAVVHGEFNYFAAEKGDTDIKLASGNGINYVELSRYADRVTGGTAKDVIYSRAGSDIIVSGGGDDEINSGDGTDVIIGGSTNLGDYLNGSQLKKDLLKTYNDSSDERTSMLYKRGTTGDFNVDYLTDVLTIQALSGNTTIRSGDGDDLIIAGSGNDTIFTGNDQDTVFAGAGDDAIFAGNANHIYGQAGNDVFTSTGNLKINVSGNEGNDFFRLGSNQQANIFAGSGNDTIISGKAATRVYAGPGDDFIRFNTDDYGIVTGSGNDTVLTLNNSAAQQIEAIKESVETTKKAVTALQTQVQRSQEAVKTTQTMVNLLKGGMTLTQLQTSGLSSVTVFTESVNNYDSSHASWALKNSPKEVTTTAVIGSANNKLEVVFDASGNIKGVVKAGKLLQAGSNDFNQLINQLEQQQSSQQQEARTLELQTETLEKELQQDQEQVEKLQQNNQTEQNSETQNNSAQQSVLELFDQQFTDVEALAGLGALGTVGLQGWRTVEGLSAKSQMTLQDQGLKWQDGKLNREL